MVVCGLRRLVSGDQVVAQCRLEAVGGECGHADCEPIEYDRPLLGGGGEECAEERGEFEAAEAAEAFERVVRVGCIRGERRGHGGLFACEALCVKAGAAAADRLGCEVGEGGEECGGDGCIADSDLAENENVATFGKRRCELMSSLGRELELLLGERRPERNVGAAVRDAAVDELGNSFAYEADIRDDELCVVRVGEDADSSFVSGGCGGDLCPDAGGIEADAVACDVVVGGEDEDPDL